MLSAMIEMKQENMLESTWKGYFKEVFCEG